MKKRSFSQLLWLLLAVLCIAVLALLAVVNAHAQTTSVAPFMGLGNVQVFDNNGNVCTACVLYSYQAGTSTQQATYTDASGNFQNPNPITFGAGGRTPIWLLSGSLYKFVLCVQNDGAFCSPGDVLFTVDQVPGGNTSSGGGGGGGSGTFSGTFISGSSNPATSGNFRLASSDSLCFRNAASSANLCVSKDTNDVLSWAGGSFKLPEVVCSNLGVGFDFLCADNSAHRLKMSNNGGGQVQVVGAGVDINNSDQVTQWHFGSVATPLGTAPTANQIIGWNGSNIVGYNLEQTFGWGLSGGGALTSGASLCSLGSISNSSCAITTFTSSHTVIRFTWYLNVAASGCGTNAVIGIRDVTSSTTLYSVTISSQSAGFQDSGALSIATTAGDVVGIGLVTVPVGCSTTPQISQLEMVYR